MKKKNRNLEKNKVTMMTIQKKKKKKTKKADIKDGS